MPTNHQSEMQARTPWIYGLGILLLVVMLLGYAGSRLWLARSDQHQGAVPGGAGKTPVVVATEFAMPRPFKEQVTCWGSVVASREQTLYPAVGGWVNDIRVRKGDKVRAGQVLAVVDSPALHTNMAEASAGYEAARRGLRSARSDARHMSAEIAAIQSEIEAATAGLNSTRTRLSAANEAVVQAQNDVADAKLEMDRGLAEVDREARLYKVGASSLQEYQAEQARAAAAEGQHRHYLAVLAEAQSSSAALQDELSNRNADLQAARHRLSAARSGLAGRQWQALQGSAETKQSMAGIASASAASSYRYLRAPMSGVVIEQHASPGQMVSTNTAIFSIAQTDSVRLVTRTSNGELRSIRPGTSVAASPLQHPDEMNYARVGTVSHPLDQGSPVTAIEALFRNPLQHFVPGDAVRLTFTTRRYSSVIAVPSSAIIQSDGTPAVWVVRATERGSAASGMHIGPDRRGYAHLVRIRLGGSSGIRTAVLSGLSVGDQIILEPDTRLREGIPVVTLR